MIIKCEKCLTKFRLDDSKLTDKGVKVRCTKCKQVFTVHKETPEDELTQPETVSAVPTSRVDDTDSRTSEKERTFLDETVPSTETDGGFLSDTSTPDTSPDYNTFESSSFDPSAFSFESDGLTDSISTDAPLAAKNEIDAGNDDFTGFNFGDSEPEPDSTPESTLTLDDFNVSTSSLDETPQKETIQKETHQGLDFSDDDMFGAVVQSEPETSKEVISFDFEGDSFAESMDVGGEESFNKTENGNSADLPADSSFSLDEIDFGDELTAVTVQQVNPEDLKPSQEILFAPLAEAQNKTPDNTTDDVLAQSFLKEDSSTNQQDLPPLSINSRRKKSSTFVGIIAIVALLLAGGVSYFAYTSFSPSKESAVTDSGQIGIRSVKAAYIENDEAGEILVISGEAVNEYKELRASLQVNVTVFDNKGQTIVKKTAYCGNPLSEEQLVSLPMEKIEAAMANQFGDSLANMELASGKAIPFVVVLANLPSEAKDYSVQPAGSTVATGKQQ